MSLTALPVTVSDLTTLQSGVQFFTNTAEATAEVTAINAPGTTESVFTYAARLIQANISLSQVAMAVSALMEGGTIPVGNTTTPNTLTLLSTQFLPGQVAVALANNFNPTVFAAESLGSALSTQASFQSFVALSPAQFAVAVSTATGVNSSAIAQFVANWQAFFTANPSALQGRTVTQASYGAAFGDAVGVALLNPTSANLQTQVSTNPAFPFTPNTIQGLVANALILIAEGKYETGKALNALPQHDLLQGEAGTPVGTLTLTVNVDTGAAFTTNIPKAIFTAPPGVNLLGPSNTLNAGDNFGSTVGDATLNFQAIAPGGLGGNPALAVGIKMFGVSTANILNSANQNAGFSGDITGLKTATMQAGSTGTVILGTPEGVGLKTALETVNVNANQNFIGWIATDALKAIDDKVTVNITGAYGVAGNAKNIVLGNDSGVPGTAATPQNAYELETISAAAASFIQLSNAASGALSTTTFTLTGAGFAELSANKAGDFAKVTTIDATALKGGSTITGALNKGATGKDVQAGLLAGNTVIASFKGGDGKDWIDLTSLNLAQVNAMTALDGAGERDTVIYAAAVVNTAAPLKATSFEIVGVNTGLTGTVDWKNLGAIDTFKLFGKAAGATTFNNVIDKGTIDFDVFGNAQAFTVNGPAAIGPDTLTLLATTANPNANDLGKLTVKDFETVNMTISKNAAGANAFDFIGGVKMTPSAGGQMVWNLTDNNDNNVNFFNAPVDLTPNGVWKIDGAGTGNIVLVNQTVTALVLDASAHAGGALLMTTTGINTTAGGATSAITITGTPLNDVLIGSNFKDTINAGAGNDIVANHVNKGNPATNTTENDLLSLGTGTDRVNLFGDTGTAGTGAAAIAGTPHVTGFDTGAGGDTVGLSINIANYQGASTILQNGGGVLSVPNVGPPTPLGAGNSFLLLTTPVAVAGQTLQQVWDQAIGAGTVTGIPATADPFVGIYDSAGGRMLVGLVENAGIIIDNTDLLHLVGTIDMTQAQFAAFTTGNFALIV